MTEPLVTLQELAPLLGVSDRIVRDAYRRASARKATIPIDEREPALSEKEEAFLDAIETPTGRPRWRREKAARILRAHGADVPEVWGV